MYRDFEDLKRRCPARIAADIAIDLHHADPGRLAEIWQSTGEAEFRLFLTGRVAAFWETQVRDRGGRAVPDDGFAIEIETDSYADPEMGHSLYLDLRAYCGTDDIGDLAWRVFADDDLEARFGRELAPQVVELLAEHIATEGLTATVEVTEVGEI